MSLTNKNRPVGFFGNQNLKESRFLEFNIEDWLRKTLIQAIACTLLFFGLLGMKYLDNTLTNRWIEEISYITNKPFHLSEGLSTLKNWGEVAKTKGEAVIETLQIGGSLGFNFSQPINGDVLAGFQEENPINGQILKGILFEADPGELVFASEEGVVVEISSNQALGYYMVIKHRGEFISVYKYLNQPLLEINSKVVKGQAIAEASDKLLFEIWERKEAQDPTQFMDFGKVKL